VVSLDFSVTYSFLPYHGSGVNSAPSENEYQEHFLRVKAAGAWGWQPHHFCVLNVMKSGSLNLLEPSGPRRACYGTHPFPWPWLVTMVATCVLKRSKSLPKSLRQFAPRSLKAEDWWSMLHWNVGLNPRTLHDIKTQYKYENSCIITIHQRTSSCYTDMEEAVLILCIILLGQWNRKVSALYSCSTGCKLNWLDCCSITYPFSQ
jgi:hypothetical protein